MGNKGQFKKGKSASPMTQFKKGASPWNKGKIGVQPSTRKGLKLKPLSEETKQKIRLANIGHRRSGWKLSEGTRLKISLGNKGKKRQGHTAWNKGIPQTEEVKNKISLNKAHNPNRVFKNTSIEIKLQDWLKKQNIKFDTNYPVMGRPDIFIKPNIVIFADGCYWHRCPECGYKESVREERKKDKRITKELQSQGYVVVRFWEHEINKNDLNQMIPAFLTS